MASPLVPSAFVLVSLLLSTAAALDGFSTDLIHRDSPKSPYYNPALTCFDRLHAAARRTVSRSEHLRRALSSTSDAFQSTIVFDSMFEYLMTLSIGTPPSKFLLIADTGSDVIWTQCKPCDKCFKRRTPAFDPSKSSTYKILDCHSKPCRDLYGTGCYPKNNSCIYGLIYGDFSSTSGFLSYETFTFESTTDKAPPVSIPTMVFLCSHSINGYFGNNTFGIAGLGGGPGSLTTQLSSTINRKFSYCLVPYNNPSATSVLSFGNRAVVGGRGAVSTPFVTGCILTFYCVRLEEIIIGDNGHQITVGRDPIQVQGNLIVDSGTTLTLLDETTILQMESKLSSMIKLPPVKMKDWRLCFNSTVVSPSDIPEITFMFTGAAVKLSPINTFVEAAEGVLCLGMLPSTDNMIYGNVAQQNFHVGYDLEAKKLSFAPADCANL